MDKEFIKNDGQWPYIKVFPEEYLGGSLHYGCDLEQRGFFMDILCLAAKNRKERGTLSLERGIPMTPPMIANALFIGEEDCKRLLEVMFEQERIHRREDGVIVVTNFVFYQGQYRRSKKDKEIIKGNAIHYSQEERLRKNVRRDPGTAIDELVTLSGGKKDEVNNE